MRRRPASRTSIDRSTGATPVPAGQAPAVPQRPRVSQILKQTGRNVSDILFRVRENLIYMRLVQKFAGQQAALGRAVRNRFKPTTSCRSPYAVPTDCGHTISTLRNTVLPLAGNVLPWIAVAEMRPPPCAVGQPDRTASERSATETAFQTRRRFNTAVMTVSNQEADQTNILRLTVCSRSWA